MVRWISTPSNLPTADQVLGVSDLERYFFARGRVVGMIFWFDRLVLGPEFRLTSQAALSNFR